MKTQEHPFHPGRFSRHLTVALCLATLFLCTVQTSAALWVKPSAEVPVRRGQGTDYKILFILQDGANVKIIEENDPWAKIETTSGRTGWLLKRYLSNNPPLQEQVAELSEQNRLLTEQATQASQEMTNLSGTNGLMETDLEDRTNELETIRQQYQKLQEDTADVMVIKNNLEKNLTKVTTLEQELAIIEKEKADLEKNYSVKWFLVGAGTLFFGWLIGVISNGSRKRKPSLY